MTAPPRPATRLSRAALYALRVGTLSVSTVAYGGSEAPSPHEVTYDAAYGGVFSPDAAMDGRPPLVGADSGTDSGAESGADATFDGDTTDGQADASFPCGHPPGSVGAAYGGFPCLSFSDDGGPLADASDAQPMLDAAYGAVPIETDAGPTDGGTPE